MLQETLMPEVTLSASRVRGEPTPDHNEPVPILRYDPQDPASVNRARQILMDYFQLSEPPLLCSPPPPRRLSGVISRIKRALAC